MSTRPRTPTASSPPQPHGYDVLEDLALLVARAGVRRSASTPSAAAGAVPTVAVRTGGGWDVADLSGGGAGLHPRQPGSDLVQSGSADDVLDGDRTGTRGHDAGRRQASRGAPSATCG